MSETNWSVFDSPEHDAAQAACRHLIHCAVNAHTREAVSANLQYARGVADGPTIAIMVGQLSGPCCLPGKEPTT